MGKKAILIGASGAIGSSLLTQLLKSTAYSNVLILVRRELPVQHPKLKQLVIDFDELRNYGSEIKGDTVFCCLGTTKSKTPDQQEYRKIDYQYPLNVAHIALANGAESYHLVSAIGANKNSSTFYTHTKGEVEESLKTILFRSIFIYRPSLLEGKRTEKRLLESISNAVMHLINPLLNGSLKKYRSIKVENVARAMLKQSLEDKKGIFTFQSDQIQDLSNN